jgi:hypothetical protein
MYRGLDSKSENNANSTVYYRILVVLCLLIEKQQINNVYLICVSFNSFPEFEGCFESNMAIQHMEPQTRFIKCRFLCSATFLKSISITFIYRTPHLGKRICFLLVKKKTYLIITLISFAINNIILNLAIFDY